MKYGRRAYRMPTESCVSNKGHLLCGNSDVIHRIDLHSRPSNKIRYTIVSVQKLYNST